MDISQYLEIFIEESKEHLQGLNTSLLDLEKGSTDKNVINEVFRAAHTLKGMAATMGFNGMNRLTHDMENVLSEIRNDNIKVDSNLLDVLFQCLDSLGVFIDNIVETGSEGEDHNEELIQKLNAILAGENTFVEVHKDKELHQPVGSEEVEHKHKYASLGLKDFENNVVLKAREEGFKCFGMTIYISENCVLKSARAFIIFRALEEMGQIIKAEPSVQEIEDENFENDFSIFVISKKNSNEIKTSLMKIAEVEDVVIGEIQGNTVIVEEEAAVTEEKSVKEDGKNKDNEDDSSNHPTNARPKTNRTVRVDIERLDILMNLVSELIIIKNGLETVETTNSNFTDQVEYLERITTNLHDAVMKVRMVPIERVFNRFPRLIRDLSRQLNKNMKFNMSGEETELDRTVIDEIGDPLVHLIRNSADHGIETPDVRISKGKDPTGQVVLKAYQDGNNVVIEVSDDGAGIDVEKVKTKAIERNVITKEQSEVMSEQEIIELLFKPSFSTAEVISDVSGRGVGLDVVKTKIEALGGIIEVENDFGQGSKMIIRLPLTLAIIQALMVNIGAEKYAIPLNTIQNIEDITPEDISYIQNQEVINLRGKVIPIIRLDTILDVEQEESNQNSITVVIVNKGDKQAGFVVSSLIGQQEIVIKSLGKFLANIKMIAGATILGDGEVALILDVNSLV